MGKDTVSQTPVYETGSSHKFFNIVASAAQFSEKDLY